MMALRFGLCLLVVAFADEDSLLQWNKWDTEETNVRLLDTVLGSQERIDKIAALTHVDESQARAGLSQAVSLLKSGSVKTQADIAKHKTTTYNSAFAESLVKAPSMSKNIQSLKEIFGQESAKLWNASSTAKLPSKTSKMADRMLREFEGKFFSKEAPVQVGITGANFGLTWGGRHMCDNMEGFAMHFQYQRQHSMQDDKFTFTMAEWHQRYGWIYGDGMEVWGQQNFPEGQAQQKSGLWLVLPYEPMTTSSTPCTTSQPMGFIVEFWMRIPNIVSQDFVGGTAYAISSTAEFLWGWPFIPGQTEPPAKPVQIGAYVDMAGPDWFSFFFTDAKMIMQYLVTTAL